MSQENVELVRRILTEFGETLQPVSDLTSPDVILNTGSWTVWTGPSEYRGTDGFMQFFGEWIAAYDDWEQEVEEIVDLGKGVTLAVSVQRGRPTGSSGEVQIRFASILLCEDGSIVWMKNYNEIDENCAAAERLAEERG